MNRPAAADHDQRRSIEQEARDRERQAKQWDAVRDYVSSHPGVSYRSAFMILSHDRPDLFRDPETGQTLEEREELHHSNQLKQQRILNEIDRIELSQAWRALGTATQDLERKNCARRKVARRPLCLGWILPKDNPFRTKGE
jgi:hypothetical protein